MGLQETEKECAAVAVAPRVSLADIEGDIQDKFFVNASDAVEAEYGALPPQTPLAVLTLCFVVMRNGFTVIGKSAPASAANFNVDLGRKLAYEDAVRQLWPLMGFALRDRLQLFAELKRENARGAGVSAGRDLAFGGPFPEE